jgi:predicted DNA binding protein
MTVQQQIPVSERVTRVEFTISNAEYPFVSASTIDGCQVILEEILPRGAGTYAEFFVVIGVDPTRIPEIAGDHGSVDATLLNEYESGGLVEFRVTGNCPAVFLSEQGALPRSVYSEDGEGHISAEIPASEDASRIVEEFLAAHSDAELSLKREQPYVTPLFGHRKYGQVLEDRFTDRQEEILTAAHERGYYDWPREITAEELADELGIAASTLLKHLRAIEQKFIETFFEHPRIHTDSPSSDVSA